MHGFATSAVVLSVCTPLRSTVAAAISALEGDAGLRTLDTISSTDGGMGTGGTLKECMGATYFRLSHSHTTLELAGSNKLQPHV